MLCSLMREGTVLGLWLSVLAGYAGDALLPRGTSQVCHILELLFIACGHSYATVEPSSFPENSNWNEHACEWVKCKGL